MELDSARDDLLVALVAAASLIGLALANRFLLGVDPGLLVELSPLYVYLAYLFTRNGDPYAGVDTPRNWAVLAVAVAVATFLFVAI